MPTRQTDQFMLGRDGQSHTVTLEDIATYLGVNFLVLMGIIDAEVIAAEGGK